MSNGPEIRTIPGGTRPSGHTIPTRKGDGTTDYAVSATMLPLPEETSSEGGGMGLAILGIGAIAAIYFLTRK